MIAIVDTETSGFSKQDRVASIAAVFYSDDLEKLEFEFSSLIKPEGWSMPPPAWDANGKAKSASAVNGLTQEKLLAEGRPMLEVWEELVPWFDQTTKIGIYNAVFDTRMITQEAEHLNQPTLVPKAKTVCLMLAMAAVIKEPGPRGDFRWIKLKDSFRYCYGVDFEGQHSAISDVKATRDIWAYARWKGWVDF